MLGPVPATVASPAPVRSARSAWRALLPWVGLLAAVAVTAFSCYPLVVAAWEAASRRPAAGAVTLGLAVVEAAHADPRFVEDCVAQTGPSALGPGPAD